MSSRGFTIIELMMAMAIGIGVLAASYACLHAGFRSRQEVETRGELLQQARVALRVMARDLRSAVVLSPDSPLVGLSRKVGGIEADNLDFATLNYVPRAEGEGGACEVSYFVDKNPETGELSLWRRRDPTIDDKPFEGGQREEIATGLRGLRFEYFDGYDWLSTWGEEPLTSNDTAARVPSANDDSGATSSFMPLPEAIRITLAFDTLTSEELEESELEARNASDLESQESDFAELDEFDAAGDLGEEDIDAAPVDRPAGPLMFRTVVKLNFAARIADAASAVMTPGTPTTPVTNPENP